MTKCPNCKEEIKELLAYSEVVHTFKLDENGNPQFEGMDYIEGYTGFECSECNERLFDTEQEAKEFLEDDKLKTILKKKLKKISSEKLGK